MGVNCRGLVTVICLFVCLFVLLVIDRQHSLRQTSKVSNGIISRRDKRIYKLYRGAVT